MEDAAPEVPQRPLGTVDTSFYLIGVGASAGGLDAIKQLIGQLPKGFQHSLVIVQHISPDYKSLMSEILGRETTLEVVEVKDNMPVEQGHIYLIPPRANLVIQGTKEDSSAVLDPAGNGNGQVSGLRFSLIEPTPRPGLNLPIDVFFHSLSEAVADRAIAVVLSGSGSDGSRGLRTVKDREGCVLVQEPDTASFDGMPKSAIATGLADMVLAPDAMIGEINRYIEMRENGVDNLDRIFGEADTEFKKILKLTSARAEIDFSQYKTPTLRRRVARRMGLMGKSTLSEYLAFLEEDKSEVNILHREFLVGVTNFFRDRPVWSALEETVLPRIFANTETSEPVRVWSVGCSTGEEAYSLAMLLDRYAKVNEIERDFRIFATDVNESAIEAAKQGVYPDNTSEEIPEEMIQRGYLSFQSGTLQVASHLRNKVFFSVHNVIDDAPYARADLIVCRNLLIYFSPDLQAKVLAQFAFSLRKGGYLMLGAAEGPGQHGGYFDAISQRARIYRNSRNIDTRNRRGLLSTEFATSENFMPRTRRMNIRSQSPTRDLTQLIQDTLSDDGSCVCIMDDQHRVLRTFGEHKAFLTIPSDSFSANLMELVDPRIRSAVALVLRRAEMEGEAEKEGLQLLDETAAKTIRLHCRKTPWESQAVAYTLTFRQRLEERQKPPKTEEPVKGSESLPSSDYVRHLEAEIQSLQDILTITAEDLGASNEELQTTNEELIASNEELQVNNEETQSINEELHTLNAENAEKINQLEAASSDISNLLATAELGMLVIDESGRIRQFSAGMSSYIDLEDSDIGRPISNFALALEPEDRVVFRDDCQLAHESGLESIREMQTLDGGWVLTRVRPYRNVHGERRGLVITFQDIAALKLLEAEVKDQRDRLEGLLESEAAGYWDWDIPNQTEYLSPRFKSMFGYEDHEMENTPDAWQEVIHEDDLPRVLDQFDAHVRSKGRIPYDNEVRYWHKDGSLVWVLCRGRVVEWTKEGDPKRMMGVHVDITELKAREQEIQARAEELRRFSFIAAHDLVQPVNTIDNALSLLFEDQTELKDPEQVAALEYLNSATARLRNRIGGILDYARLQDQTLELEVVDLQNVVHTALADLEAQIDEAEAKVVVVDLPNASGSAQLLTQVMQNLLSNALKYRHTDKPCEIRIEPAEAPDRMVAFKVSDNGIGIAPEYRQKVFELFSRLHTDQEYAGSGLGLALCERIVNKHGGMISIADGLDGGTSFKVVLNAG